MNQKLNLIIIACLTIMLISLIANLITTAYSCYWSNKVKKEREKLRRK